MEAWSNRNIMTQVVIAERKLLYSLKAKQDRREFTVRVYLPRRIDEKTMGGWFDDDARICTVELAGLNERNIDSHGADSLQALTFAADVDRWLQRLSKKYDFYYLTGEPYFDEV